MDATTENLRSMEQRITEISQHDVLCGRGGGTNKHLGNMRYRQIVSEHQIEYLIAKRERKREIGFNIVARIRQTGGRFVEKRKEKGAPKGTGEYYIEIGDERAVFKTCQALRDGLCERRNENRCILDGHEQEHHPSLGIFGKKRKYGAAPEGEDKESSSQLPVPPLRRRSESLAPSSSLVVRDHTEDRFSAPNLRVVPPRPDILNSTMAQSPQKLPQLGRLSPAPSFDQMDFPGSCRGEEKMNGIRTSFAALEPLSIESDVQIELAALPDFFPFDIPPDPMNNLNSDFDTFS